MTSPEYWKKAKAHLSKRDPVLKAIIKSYKGEMLVSRGDAFYTLARSIVGQQISVKAADSVWKKFESMAKKVTPANIRRMSPEALRACGLSQSKATYMHALAEHFASHKATIRKWPEMDDEAIISELVSIKGIGRWTAEMFLIFHLGRPDIFPAGDLGVLKAMYLHYNKGDRMTLSQARQQAETWQPYRTVATWYLWRSLDPAPVAY